MTRVRLACTLVDALTAPTTLAALTLTRVTRVTMPTRVTTLIHLVAPTALVALTVSALMVLAACGPAPEPSTPSAEVAVGCGDAPDVTWDTFADGFFASRCQACHASASPDRRGAPAEVAFDEESAALAFADRVRARVLDAEPSMPPGGGVSEDERALLDVWLRCSR